MSEVQLVRSVRVQVKGGPVMLVALDVGSVERRAKLPAVEGDPTTMYRRTRRGEAVLASENFVRLHAARLGEVLEIPAPSGTLRLPIAGIVRDFSDQQGSLLISRDAYIRAWHDDAVNVFRLYLAPGANSAEVRQRILDAFGKQQRLFVLTNKDVRDYVTRLTDQWFGLTYVQIAVAVLVAVLGIVNALTVSITDRRRELGVLQAVGGLRQQIRHTVWMEAAAIGLIGLALGLSSEPPNSTTPSRSPRARSSRHRHRLLLPLRNRPSISSRDPRRSIPSRPGTRRKRRPRLSSRGPRI